MSEEGGLIDRNGFKNESFIRGENKERARAAFGGLVGGESRKNGIDVKRMQ